MTEDNRNQNQPAPGDGEGEKSDRPGDFGRKDGSTPITYFNPSKLPQQPSEGDKGSGDKKE